MNRLIRRTIGMLTAAVMLFVVVIPASAGGNSQIGGAGVFDGDEICGPSLYTMVMTGDLVGCWYTDTFDVVAETPSGIYQERGTETFVGCWQGDPAKCGSFSTTYKFTAKYSLVDGSEIHGRCQHPITTGTGYFAGITGRVDFKDNVETGVATYRGHIKFP